MGVRIQQVTKEIAEVEKLGEPRGALVASVSKNSPSDKAGVKAGDIILEFDGTKIKEMVELPKIVAQTKVGKTVKVRIWRNKKELTKQITLGRLETSEDFISERTEADPNISEIESLKITVRVLSAKDIEDRKLPKNTSGLVITGIKKDSPIINYLRVNDIILETQKKKIKSIEDLERVVNNVLQSEEKTILFVIYNNQNQRRYIGVKLN